MTSAGILKQRLSLRFLAVMVVAVMSIWFSGQPVASQSLPEIVAGFTPKGWKIFDEIKQFTPENVYEQINGRASFFQAYDMISLIYVSFVKSDEDAKFINLSIYDMGTPTNAFGVFSSERSPGESTRRSRGPARAGRPAARPGRRLCSSRRAFRAMVRLQRPGRDRAIGVRRLSELPTQLLGHPARVDERIRCRPIEGFDEGTLRVPQSPPPIALEDLATISPGLRTEVLVQHDPLGPRDASHLALRERYHRFDAQFVARTPQRAQQRVLSVLQSVVAVEDQPPHTRRRRYLDDPMHALRCRERTVERRCRGGRYVKYLQWIHRQVDCREAIRADPGRSHGTRGKPGHEQ